MGHLPEATTRPIRGKGYTQQEIRVGLWHCMLAWVFGSGFFAITGGAAFNSFLTRYLHTSDSIYGLVSATGSIGAVFLVLGSYTVERTGRVKGNFLLLVTLHRLLWLGIAAIPLLMPYREGASATTQVVLVCVILLISTIAANYGGAGWTAWMSAIVPNNIAGKFFGTRATIGLVSMVVIASIMTPLIDLYGSHGWIYALIFSVAALLGAIDILLFIPVREVPRPPAAAHTPTLVDIFTIPWRNVLFRRFALYSSVTWFAYLMMGAYVWRYAFAPPADRGLDLPVWMANLLLFTLPTAIMAITSPFWGQAIDRFGPKSVLRVAALSQILLPLGWLFMRPDYSWMILFIVGIGGAFWPGIDQVTFYMQLKGFPDKHRSAYTAMFQVVLGLSMMAGTTVGGYYAGFLQTHLHDVALLPAWVSHYHPLFLTAILIRLASFLLLLPRLPMSDTGSKRQVVSAVAGGVAGTVPRLARRLSRRR